jgi:hypothetical protein
MRRAARWDGWLPNLVSADAPTGPLSVDHLREGVDWIRQARAAEGLTMAGYDVIAEGATPADDRAAARAVVTPWQRAGATWWIEADWSVAEDHVREYAERRLAAGPPS